jgi:3-carboxy-cis,cis-muconate cycloisomerase
VPPRLIDSLATTAPLAEVFSDASVLRAMLTFEAALARAEAKVGVIPKAAAASISAIIENSEFDAADLGRRALRAGTLAIPLVKLLTERVNGKDPEAARYIHWGATSQDVADTALLLLLKNANSIISADVLRLEDALGRLSDQHRNTVMLGRTLLQAAPPTTFGLKAAGWFGAIRRSRIRLENAFRETAVLQFGGASGTLAALEDKGVAVGRALADELEIGYPDAPWHTHRDRLAAYVTSCGVLAGCLGKMARDISLLMQAEVAEVAEPGGAGRGGSSTMPNKRNPIACAITLSAANRVPGLVAGFLSSMVQEHERAVGGWQAEWPTVAAIVEATGLASASMAEAADGLEISVVTMRDNISATKGNVFAERAMMLLGPSLGRSAAHELVQKASQRSAAERRRLSEVLGEMPEVTNVLSQQTIRALENPEEYLGIAEEFRKRLLSRHAPSQSGEEKE